MKRAIIGAIVVACTLACTTTPAFAVTNTVAQAKSKVTATQKIVNEINSNMSNVESSIKSNDSKINSLNSQIDSLQSQMGTLGNTLKSERAELNKALVGIYENNSTDLWLNAFLDSKNFSSLINNLNVAYQVTTYQEGLMDKIKSNITVLDSDQSKLQSEMDNLNSIQQQNESKLKKLKQESISAESLESSQEQAVALAEAKKVEEQAQQAQEIRNQKLEQQDQAKEQQAKQELKNATEQMEIVNDKIEKEGNNYSGDTKTNSFKNSGSDTVVKYVQPKQVTNTTKEETTSSVSKATKVVKQTSESKKATVSSTSSDNLTQAQKEVYSQPNDGTDSTSGMASAINGSSAEVQEIIEYASQFIGDNYVWGGENPNVGFDCSGLVQYVFRHFGVDLPRTTYTQVNCGTAVSLANIKPGDLVFEIPSAEGPDHVGIYIGGGKILNAMDPANGVCISPLYEVVAVRNVL